MAKLRDRLVACARDNTPENVSLVRIRKYVNGRALVRSGILEAPRPDTREALFVYLLYCAWFTDPEFFRDREISTIKKTLIAGQWAAARMRTAGIEPPKE